MTDAEYIAEAKRQYAEEGAIEIDSDATVSRSKDGAYVQAWVWVSDEPSATQLPESIADDGSIAV